MPLVLFDGVCNLCNSSVQFVIRHDRKKQFYFASLQGTTGQQVLKDFSLPTDTFNSFILIDQGVAYRESTAVLTLLKKLGGFWQLAYLFILIPAFIRNALYRFIARNRYRWFGKKDSCMVPAPELKKRFLL